MDTATLLRAYDEVCLRLEVAGMLANDSEKDGTKLLAKRRRQYMVFRTRLLRQAEEGDRARRALRATNPELNKETR